MKVTVKLFATLKKDRFSEPSAVDLDDGSTVRDLLEHLRIDEIDVGILVINARDATFDQKLSAGDSVTIIPPIGGG